MRSVSLAASIRSTTLFTVRPQSASPKAASSPTGPTAFSRPQQPNRRRTDYSMANLETEILDEIVVKSRRKMLALGGTALAGLVLARATPAAAASYSDSDILNFALNLEYLEANF